jgi:2-keto-3-deoxy-L-rhamnonate aldolase RhmA
MVQIETVKGFDNLAAIAAVPGVDSIFIGPSDLAASMGLLGDVGNAAVQEKLKRGRETVAATAQALRHSRHESRDDAQFIGYGYDWVAIGSDMAFMVGRAQEVLGKARAAPPPRAGRGAD